MSDQDRSAQTREDARDEIICDGCHRYVDEDERYCPQCEEGKRAGF